MAGKVKVPKTKANKLASPSTKKSWLSGVSGYLNPQTVGLGVAGILGSAGVVEAFQQLGLDPKTFFANPLVLGGMALAVFLVLK